MMKLFVLFTTFFISVNILAIENEILLEELPELTEVMQIEESPSYSDEVTQMEEIADEVKPVEEIPNYSDELIIYEYSYKDPGSKEGYSPVFSIKGDRRKVVQWGPLTIKNFSLEFHTGGRYDHEVKGPAKVITKPEKSPTSIDPLKWVAYFRFDYEFDCEASYNGAKEAILILSFHGPNFTTYHTLEYDGHHPKEGLFYITKGKGSHNPTKTNGSYRAYEFYQFPKEPGDYEVRIHYIWKNESNGILPLLRWPTVVRYEASDPRSKFPNANATVGIVSIGKNPPTNDANFEAYLLKKYGTISK